MVSPRSLLASGLAAVDWASIRCGPATLPTPTYGLDGAVFAVCAEQTVAAPVAAVYGAVLDFAAYGTWNSFVRDVAPLRGGSLDDVARPGLTMLFTTAGLLGSLNSTSIETLSVVTPPGATAATAAAASAADDHDVDFAMVAWKLDDGLGGASERAEHPSIMVGLPGGGGTRIVSFESYYGPLAPLLQGLIGTKLQAQFEQQAKDLGVYVERIVSGTR